MHIDGVSEMILHGMSLCILVQCHSPCANFSIPHASIPFQEYHAAHSARALDGLMFLYINVYLMLSSVNLLSIFLNFSALMFLQQIDNIALKLCLDGYWTRVSCMCYYILFGCLSIMCILMLTLILYYSELTRMCSRYC